MLTEGKLKTLCENAACALTGRKVVVRLAAPVVKDFDGEYYSVGEGVVNVKLDLPDETFLYVLLHELGHAALKHTTNTFAGLAPGALELTPAGENIYKYSPSSRKREDACDELAKRWLYFAAQNYARFEGETILERKLKALGSYVQPRLQARAAQAGTKEGETLAEVMLWKAGQERLADKFQQKVRKLMKGQK